MASNAFDPRKKFVRITGTRPNDLVDFEFSVGEPELMVELIMPREAFDEFCNVNEVIFLEPETTSAAESSGSEWKWNLHLATQQRFR